MTAVGAFDVDAVVFDLDGTLLDSEKAITVAGELAFADIGMTVTALQIADHLGAPLEELYALFAPAFGGDGDDVRMRAFIQHYIARHDAHPDRFPPPLPGVRAAVAALLERGLFLAVATTKPSARAKEQLEGCGLLPAFHHVQGTDPGMKPKPAPDVVLAACKALSVPPARALMVGDTQRDVLAGKAAGAFTAVVGYDDARLKAAQTFGAGRVVGALTALLD